MLFLAVFRTLTLCHAHTNYFFSKILFDNNQVQHKSIFQAQPVLGVFMWSVGVPIVKLWDFLFWVIWCEQNTTESRWVISMTVYISCKNIALVLGKLHYTVLSSPSRTWNLILYVRVETIVSCRGLVATSRGLSSTATYSTLKECPKWSLHFFKAKKWKLTKSLLK